MALIDLDDCIPDELADSAKTGDLLDTLLQNEQWTRRQADVLDFIYLCRTFRLLRSRKQQQDLIDFINHLDRATTPLALQHLNRFDPAYGARWTAYKDLLDTRLAAIQSPALQAVLAKDHVTNILNLIKDDNPVPYKEIQKKLGLKAPNLTRVLDLMEANELIERRKEGREMMITLGPSGLDFFLSRKEAQAPTPKMDRCSSLLTLSLKHSTRLQIKRVFHPTRLRKKIGRPRLLPANPLERYNGGRPRVGDPTLSPSALGNEPSRRL